MTLKELAEDIFGDSFMAQPDSDGGIIFPDMETKRKYCQAMYEIKKNRQPMNESIIIVIQDNKIWLGKNDDDRHGWIDPEGSTIDISAGADFFEMRQVTIEEMIATVKENLQK